MRMSLFELQKTICFTKTEPDLDDLSSQIIPAPEKFDSEEAEVAVIPCKPSASFVKLGKAAPFFLRNFLDVISAVVDRYN